MVASLKPFVSVEGIQVCDVGVAIAEADAIATIAVTAANTFVRFICGSLATFCHADLDATVITDYFSPSKVTFNVSTFTRGSPKKLSWRSSVA